MSKIYDALKRAEQERSTKRQSLRVFPEEPAYKEKIEAIDQKVIDRPRAPRRQIDDLLVVVTDPLSQAAEQFKKVCIRMLLVGQDNNRVFLVTSPLPLEGKTTISTNLAAGLAQLPQTHAILIDADLRKTPIHEMLGVTVDKGLMEYLEDRADVSEICYQTLIPRLLTIPAGELCSDPAEIFSSLKIRRLIEELKIKYPETFIIVDSTPLLITTEPDVILNEVDSIILVVRYGKTKRDSLERVLHSLDKRKVLGIVFNEVDSSILQNRYKYQYHYYGNSKPRKKRS